MNNPTLFYPHPSADQTEGPGIRGPEQNKYPVTVTVGPSNGSQNLLSPRTPSVQTHRCCSCLHQFGWVVNLLSSSTYAGNLAISGSAEGHNRALVSRYFCPSKVTQ